MKRIIAILTVIIMALCSVPAAVAEGDVIEIRTAAELQAIRNNLSGNYILMGNITLKSAFSPIAPEEDRPFTGKLDGNGYTIFGLNVQTAASGTAVGGLIGYNAGTVENLAVQDASVTVCGTDPYGNAYTYAGIIAAVNNGVIIRCSVSGTVSGESKALTAYVGGITGKNLAEIRACANYAAVSATGVSEGAAGGIVGWNQYIVYDCYNVGTVCAADAGDVALLRAGGIAGKNGFAGNGTILRSLNIGTVTAAGSEQQVGGIAGNNLRTVMNCYYDRACTAAAIGSTGNQAGALDRAAMSSAASFPALKFETVWRMAYYPMLRNVRSFAPTLPGDVNLDGAVRTDDVIIMMQYLVGGSALSFETIDADMNIDKRISIADAVLLLRKIAG